jgi:hypothetical protein
VRLAPGWAAVPEAQQIFSEFAPITLTLQAIHRGRHCDAFQVYAVADTSHVTLVPGIEFGTRRKPLPAAHVRVQIACPP